VAYPRRLCIDREPGLRCHGATLGCCMYTRGQGSARVRSLESHGDRRAAAPDKVFTLRYMTAYRPAHTVTYLEDQ